MRNHEYLWPGIAALLLALCFPVYWLSIFHLSSENFMEVYKADLLKLSWSDLAFVLIGALEVYVYLSLRRSFAERLQSGSAAVLLLVMTLLVVAFHATVVVDLVIVFSGGVMPDAQLSMIAETTVAVALGILFAYAVVAFVLAIVLLLKRTAASGLLKCFAVVLLVCCVLQFSVFLSPGTIFLFPVALLLLAFYFLKEPQELELV
ncbi:hypothetical protein [Rheinheimera soli]|uniref:hypothetical protein n=1 Tax=Rheinheimera soli TaxID=443616 RepID=UPI001E5FCA15|nr:hypothetical protein [Rheinheimera soli]